MAVTGDQKDGVKGRCQTGYQLSLIHISGESIILSWNASGEVESYTVYVENQAGERVDLGTMTETSRTVSTSRLPAGIYTVYVGAMPVGGSEEDVVWGLSLIHISPS